MNLFINCLIGLTIASVLLGLVSLFHIDYYGSYFTKDEEKADFWCKLLLGAGVSFISGLLSLGLAHWMM